MDQNGMPSESRTTDHAEESSWTKYLGDFLIDNNKKSLLISSDNNSSSLVSDATSSIMRVFGDGTRTISCKGITFKKRESRDSIIQDALEDTASSPNCPKVRSPADRFLHVYMFCSRMCISARSFEWIKTEIHRLVLIQFLGRNNDFPDHA